MKKIMLSLAAVVLLAACAKEAQPNDATTPADENLVTYTFTAANPNEATRSTLTNAGVFTWQEGDKIAIHDNTSASNVVFEVTAVDGEGNATITADAAPGAVWTNAIYPAARAKVSGNYIDFSNPGNAPAGPVLVSKVAGQDLSFKYAGAVVNITLNDIPDTPTSLTLTANAGTPFAEYPLTWDGENPVLGTGTSATSFITVPYAGNGNVTSIPVPHHNFASGFTITVDNAAGRHLFVKSTTKAKDLTSKILLPMDAINYEAPSAYYLKTVANKTDFWSAADVPFIKTGTDTYKLVVNADRMSDYYVYDEWNTDAPTTHQIKSGKTTEDAFTENTYSIIGACNKWTLEDNATYMLNAIGNWNYILGAEDLHNTEFKFNPAGNTASTTNNWKLPWGHETGAWFSFKEKVYSLDMIPDKGNTGLYCSDEGDLAVDIYFNAVDKKGQCYPAGYKGNPLCSLVEFTYDSNLENLSVNIVKQAVAKPFGEANFPENNMTISGSFNSWGENALNYNGNLSWVGEITVATAGETQFVLKREGDWKYKAGGTDLGTNLFGELTVKDDISNAKVTLEAGKYQVYVNVSSTDWKHNIMFVKK